MKRIALTLAVLTLTASTALAHPASCPSPQEVRRVYDQCLRETSHCMRCLPGNGGNCSCTVAQEDCALAQALIKAAEGCAASAKKADVR